MEVDTLPSQVELCKRLRQYLTNLTSSLLSFFFSKTLAIVPLEAEAPQIAYEFADGHSTRINVWWRRALCRA